MFFVLRVFKCMFRSHNFLNVDSFFILFILLIKQFLQFFNFILLNLLLFLFFLFLLFLLFLFFHSIIFFCLGTIYYMQLIGNTHLVLIIGIRKIRDIWCYLSMRLYKLIYIHALKLVLKI